MKQNQAARIVILGAGFAGLRCALELNRKLAPAHQIILVDQHPYHLITPALYQVATGETPNRTVAIPITTILKPTRINFIKDKVVEIDNMTRRVRLATQELSYDLVVVAFGSRTDYYGIRGLQNYAIPLKTIYDAGWLRLNLHHLFQTKVDQPKRIIIGGGGFAGCELVGEIVLAVETLADKYKVPRENVEVAIVEGADHLLPGLPLKVTERVRKRLEWLGVKLYLGRRLVRVSRNRVELSTGEKLDYELLVWTGGVCANDVDLRDHVEKHRRGNVIVDEFLRCDPSTFVIGDVALCKEPKTGAPLPGTIPIAVQEGKSVATNVARLLAGRRLKRYRPLHSGYIIPLTGKYAVAMLELPGRPVFAGRIAFALFQFVLLRYFWRILPAKTAMRYWRSWRRNVSRIHAATQLHRPTPWSVDAL